MKNRKIKKKLTVFAVFTVIIAFIAVIVLIGCCDYPITLKTTLAFITCVLLSNGLSHFFGKFSENNNQYNNKGDAYEKEMV